MYRYLREDVKKLKPYEVNEIQYTVKLDANEAIDWLDGLNRYPDDRCSDLKAKLADSLNKKPEELLIGNGSSELIGYTMNAYLEAGEVVASFSPTFSMYEIYTIINKGKYLSYPLDNLTYLNVEGFINFIRENKVKIVIISNPNNPTGSVIPMEEIKRIVKSVDAMVVLDEAYIEFSDLPLEDFTREFKNLVVLRTFSKAMGLAGIRLGYMIGQEETIGYIDRIRSPYNVNTLSQAIGIKALENKEVIEKSIDKIKLQRNQMKEQLEEKGFNVLPSQGNFLLFQGGKDLDKALGEKGVLIRGFGGELEGYYRLTIASEKENNIFIKALEEVENEKRKSN